MIKIDDLSLEERHDLSLAASMACVDRLEKMVRWADPADDALRRLLDSLVDNAELRIRDLEQAQVQFKSAAPFRLRHADIKQMIEIYFPSLSKPLGEGYLDREGGMYLAECLEEESAHFFRMMARLAPDERSRQFFRRSEKSEESFLDHVRHVLLQSRRTPAPGLARGDRGAGVIPSAKP